MEIIMKDMLAKKATFENENFKIIFDKNNKLNYLIPNSATTVRIYCKEGNIKSLLIISKDGDLGLDILTTNAILKVFGFELED